MPTRSWMRCTSAALFLVAAVLACSSPFGVSPSGAPGPGTPTPANVTAAPPTPGTPASGASAAPPTATSPVTEAAASRGPGSFDVSDATVGLSGLTSYRATLQMQFAGTEAGQPSQWTRALSLVVSRQPAARLWTLDSTAPSDQDIAALVGGELAGVSYSRAQTDDPCVAEALRPNDPLPPPLQPAELLPPVLGAEAAGAAQTINGVSANHYTFDARALDLVGTAQASGEVWVAVQGGFVVKLLLTAQGNADYFGQGIQGKMTWDYELNNANQSFAVDPPPGCPPGLVDLPLPAGAAGVMQDPGLTTYTSTMSASDLAAFYTSTLTTAGWQAAGAPLVTSSQALLTYASGNQQLTVQVNAAGGIAQVLVSLQSAGQAAAGPTPTLVATSAGAADPGRLISKALGLTLGTGQPPVLPSARLEASGADPAWNRSLRKAEVTTYTVQADMQGADLHLLYSTAKANPIDGYIVGGKEYRLVNGHAQLAPGSVKLYWAEWPLNAGFALAAAATGATPQGETDLGGRTAQVFAVDSANANPAALAALKGFSDITASKGTVWIDKDTGALLKATLDYQATLTDPASKAVLGTGNGHVEIAVSNVGSVTVALP